MEVLRIIHFEAHRSRGDARQVDKLRCKTAGADPRNELAGL